MHYAIWTGWIAQDCLRGEGTLTFRMTARALVTDFGPRLLALIGLAIVAFFAVACVHPREAVYSYTHLARAHVWFEAAVFAYLSPR